MMTYTCLLNFVRLGHMKTKVIGAARSRAMARALLMQSVRSNDRRNLAKIGLIPLPRAS